MMTELSPEQKKKVEKVISQVSEEEGMSWWEARTLIHKCICGGKCAWYKTRSVEAGFDRLSIAKEQKKRVEETIKRVMKDMTIKKAEALIHEFICPGHPRPSE
jgi:hypothetical protein